MVAVKCDGEVAVLYGICRKVTNSLLLVTLLDLEQIVMVIFYTNSQTEFMLLHQKGPMIQICEFIHGECQNDA